MSDMKGVINTHWNHSNYLPNYTAGRFSWDGLEMSYRVENTTDYCGAVFICSFEYNWELRELYLRMMERGERADRLKMNEWYRRLRYHLALHHLKVRSGREDYPDLNEYDYEYYGRIHDMDFSFWEIEQRPMYGFGKYMKMRHTRPTVNPNSGNLAAFFTGEFGRDVYYRGWRRWGTDWVHVLSKRIEDYPFDIDGEYREPEYDDEEW